MVIKIPLIYITIPWEIIEKQILYFSYFRYAHLGYRPGPPVSGYIKPGLLLWLF